MYFDCFLVHNWFRASTEMAVEMCYLVFSSIIDVVSVSCSVIIPRD